jgi:hypothetical protein
MDAQERAEWAAARKREREAEEEWAATTSAPRADSPTGRHTNATGPRHYVADWSRCGRARAAARLVGSGI